MALIKVRYWVGCGEVGCWGDSARLSLVAGQQTAEQVPEAASLTLTTESLTTESLTTQCLSGAAGCGPRHDRPQDRTDHRPALSEELSAQRTSAEGSEKAGGQGSKSHVELQVDRMRPLSLRRVQYGRSEPN